MSYTPEQRRIISLANSLSAGYGPRVRKSLLEALAVESSYRNLNYGDRDSQGVLQQRPSQGWGPAGNPRQDINQYLSRAGALAQRGFRGTAGQLAQAVQRSAYPGRYDQHRAEAERLLGSTPSSGGPAAPAGVPRASRASARSVADALLNPRIANDPVALVQALTSHGSPGMAAPPGEPPAGAHGPVGKVSLSPGADRPGVHTSSDVLDFVRKIAGLAGEKLAIGTGTQHSQYVAGTHRESAHWTGRAADIPASGAELIKIGQDALIAAGMPPRQARKIRGGLFNYGDYQVIFNTHEGGDHTNHLHVGLRR